MQKRSDAKIDKTKEKFDFLTRQLPRDNGKRVKEYQELWSGSLKGALVGT